MAGVPGRPAPELSELVRAADRLSFLYMEQCTVHRDANAITATDRRGTVHVPAATLGVLMLGPGTRITHQAMTLLAQSGSSVVWVGEEGVRYYAHGRPLTLSSRLAMAQARAVATTRSRLKVARAMYEMRFRNEDVAGLTLQQLRGREGVRMRKVYLAEAKRTGVAWKRRDYAVDDFDAGDTVNKALSAANTALYGVVHSVIVALGCSPALGFVHTGNIRSFVFDMADLYKADFTIPLAFDLAAAEPPDVSAAARRAVRDRMRDGGFMQRCVGDLRALLLADDAEEIAVEFDDADKDVLRLWDGGAGAVAGGLNYGGDDEAS